MKTKKFKYFIGDFETTVYKGQVATEVWASALVELYSEDVKIFHSIDETYNYLLGLDCNVCVYYHNLKFDGAFWLSYLICDLKYKQAVVKRSEKEYDVRFIYDSEMVNKTFKYSISDMGQWYSITIKDKNHIIELRDSYKLLPFSVERIGESFKTKHRKLSMEYEGFRYSGCEITPREREYISNDVMVMKEAVEIMFDEGHNKLTIGACCLAEYRKIMGEYNYNTFFPDLESITIDKEQYGAENADEYIRKAYKGGWCYLVKGKEGNVVYNGVTVDVNSLYPSMMSSESGNKYPVGIPHFWQGNIPHRAQLDGTYYFVRIRTRFYIKPNKLPCIQIKNSFLYNGKEWLETSDVYFEKTQKHYKQIKGFDGTIKDTRVTLTLTMTDFELIKEHYDLVDFEVLDGCWFYSEVGIFDEYIEKYKKIKLENKGAKRELAKLFLNNLYGKMASSSNSSFKLAYEKDDGSIGFVEVVEFEKKTGYIAVGAAITSYSRNFTIRAAQHNYHGKDRQGFIYADTDSIHCDIPQDELKGVTIHDKNFCCWKVEGEWDRAIFTRQKTYIEHIVKKEDKELEEPFYDIKCAGMPDKCKELFRKSLYKHSKQTWETEYKEVWNKLNEEEKTFISTPRELTDFKVGLIVPSKLVPKRIRGGVLLVETTYEMR